MGKRSGKSVGYSSTYSMTVREGNYGQGCEANKQPSKALIPVQKINNNQMKEMRENDLCYYCDSKWN